jgi:hypothetical protein
MSRIDEIRERRSKIPPIGYLVTALSTLRGGDECIELLTRDIDYLISCIEGRGVEDRDPRDMTDDELNAAVDFHRAQAARYFNEGAKIWRLRIRLNGGEEIDKKMLADLHARRAATTSTAGGERCAERWSDWLMELRRKHGGPGGPIQLPHNFHWAIAEQLAKCVFPAPPEPQKDDGWVTFGRVKVDIENETETFERIHPPTPVPAEAAAQDTIWRGQKEYISVENYVAMQSRLNAEIARLTEESASWRRVAERLEGEKISARADAIDEAKVFANQCLQEHNHRTGEDGEQSNPASCIYWALEDLKQKGN